MFVSGTRLTRVLVLRQLLNWTFMNLKVKVKLTTPVFSLKVMALFVALC